MYLIVWKYIVKAENKDIFEEQYGPNGVWNSLFRKSEDYKGSYLHRGDTGSLTYLLIDTWKDKVSYENFKKKNKTGYTNQSDALEYLYEKEELIGNYSSLE